MKAIICDFCGARTSDIVRDRWLSVTRWRPMTVVEEQEAARWPFGSQGAPSDSWHFCSPDCVANFGALSALNADGRP